MPANNSRLDRLLSKRLNIKRKAIKPFIAQHIIEVNGVRVFNVDMPVNQFSVIKVNGETLQEKQAYYVMLNKPKGYVSATKDTIHPTIMELIHEPFRDELRIVGRLDFNTTGLMLLSNDTDWSHSLSHSTKNIMKRYLVTVKEPIDYSRYQHTFTQGIYFKQENTMTLPATLVEINRYQAYLDISEGKYHQVKRMFGHFNNEVVELHRMSIGEFRLCEKLTPGSYKMIQPEEPSFLIRR